MFIQKTKKYFPFLNAIQSSICSSTVLVDLIQATYVHQGHSAWRKRKSTSTWRRGALAKMHPVRTETTVSVNTAQTATTTKETMDQINCLALAAARGEEITRMGKKETTERR